MGGPHREGMFIFTADIRKSTFSSQLMVVFFLKQMCPLLNFHFKPQGGTCTGAQDKVLIHRAENLIRPRQTTGTGSCPKEERKLTSACHSWAPGHAQLCSDQAATS